MRTKPFLNFTGSAVIVTVWHYSATYSRDAIEQLVNKHFSDIAQMSNGRIDWETQMTFFQDDLIDIIDDCITYHNLQPYQIEQL